MRFYVLSDFTDKLWLNVADKYLFFYYRLISTNDIDIAMQNQIELLSAFKLGMHPNWIHYIG